MSFKINITVLVAPLDWGLGHCTRCIPLILHFLKLGCTVLVAAEGAQAKLLQTEFPSITILPLRGYRIRYSNGKRMFAMKILWQLPKIIRSIKNEQIWLNGVVEKHKIDVVISDNRYGLYHSKIPSILITHQLRVQTPFGWAGQMVQRQIYKYINQFTACWVPDSAGEDNLAGKLSHPELMPRVPVVYIGPLSRMQFSGTEKTAFDLLILLSGPEPQRTLLEEKLIRELTNFTGKVMLVRGLPLSTETLKIERATVVNHLPSQQLQTAINQSEIVISRSGYSTVMDLCKLQKKAILIPTPGQTEQEYLGEYLQEKGWCLYRDQENFSLKEAVESVQHLQQSFSNILMEDYKQVVEDLVSTLGKKQHSNTIPLHANKD